MSAFSSEYSSSAVVILSCLTGRELSCTPKGWGGRRRHPPRRGAERSGVARRVRDVSFSELFGGRSLRCEPRRARVSTRATTRLARAPFGGPVRAKRAPTEHNIRRHPCRLFLRHALWYKPFSHTSQQLVEFKDVMTSFNTAAGGHGADLLRSPPVRHPGAGETAGTNHRTTSRLTANASSARLHLLATSQPNDRAGLLP